MPQPTEIRHVRTRRGLDLRISGVPAQEIAEQRDPPTVAVLGRDYRGVTAKLVVQEGDRVRLGQALFEDRRRPQVKITSPASGIVTQINRGERRALESIVIERTSGDGLPFPAHDAARLSTLARETVADILLGSGLWTAFRTRPFGNVPDPQAVPRSIFVTAIDTNPLAVDPAVVTSEHPEDFENGMSALTRLTEGPVFLCRSRGAAIPGGDGELINIVEFEGPHPAGLPGTHIHLLDPVGPGRTVWHVGYQDVIAIGKLLTTGVLCPERIVSLAGPGVLRPRLLRTRMGASTEALCDGELDGAERRVISGPVLSGHRAEGALAYLGRHQLQVSVLVESAIPAGGPLPARMNNWASSGSLVGKWLGKGKLQDATTALNGRPAALVPIDAFERVLPLDILPVPLFRALLVGDLDAARALGCLELDDEDLALCSYLCPGKHDYGSGLRSALNAIQREGL